MSMNLSFNQGMGNAAVLDKMSLREIKAMMDRRSESTHWRYCFGHLPRNKSEWIEAACTILDELAIDLTGEIPRRKANREILRKLSIRQIKLLLKERKVQRYAWCRYNRWPKLKEEWIEAACYALDEKDILLESILSPHGREGSPSAGSDPDRSPASTA